jgi:AcrR family transcriptional regulator
MGSIPNSAEQLQGQRAQLKRQLILKTACELLVERGIAAMTMEEVAARAGVAKTTVYRRWPTKGALAIEGFLTDMSVRLRYDDSGSAIEDVKSQLKRVAETFKSPMGKVISGLIAEAQRDPETLTAFVNGYVLQRRSTTAALFKRAIDRGELRPDIDIDLAIDLFYAPIYYRMLMGLEIYDSEKIERLVDAIMRGLNGEFKQADPRSKPA